MNDLLTLRKLAVSATLCALGLLVVGASASAGEMTDKNKAVVQRYLEEIVNQGKLAVADEIIGAEYVYHGRGPEGKGPELVKAIVSVYRTAFPDLHLTLEDLIAEGDRVAVRVTGTGTNTGTLMDTPPTGKKVSVVALLIVRVADGKVVEEWEVVDELGTLEQLGLMSHE